jgi:hypothetical protein
MFFRRNANESTSFISTKSEKLKKMHRRTLIHEFKRQRRTLATITVDGAWMDTKTQKSQSNTTTAIDVMNMMPKSDEFTQL